MRVFFSPTGSWTIGTARSVVAAAVDAGKIADVFERSRLDAEMSITMAPTDKRVIAREPLFAGSSDCASRELPAQRMRKWMLYLDIDSFEEVNSTMGPAGGAAALVEFSRLPKACVCQTDFVARWSGEELVILLYEARNPPRLSGWRAR